MSAEKTLNGLSKMNRVYLLKNVCTAHGTKHHGWMRVYSSGGMQ